MKPARTNLAHWAPRKLWQHLATLITAEDGATVVEYAVMLALIIAVCLTAITLIGNTANQTFSTVGSSLTGP
jgi:pilus assembly protein Flp/PilA